MILTVTMNPSIDIAYQMKNFSLDQVNRAEETHKTPGGKGLNVTRVLYAIGEEVTATGLTGGKNGEFLQEQLNKAGIDSSFYKIKGDTRNCIAILHEGKQTEILEQGPIISKKEFQGFTHFFQKKVKKYDAVVFSGSLPGGIPDTCYADLITIASKENIPVILDCSGSALKKALEARPTAIKPNIDELKDLLHQEIAKDPKVLKEVLSSDMFTGIPWIIISLGADGCFAKHDDHYYHVHIPKIEVVSPVGSGDSTVAGIASGIVNGLSDEELLKHANTLGMLNAQEKETGTVNMNHYDDLYRQITITKV